jgi:hypothetical protein
MKTPAAKPSRSSFTRRLAALSAGVAGAALLFAGGRWTAEPPAPRRASVEIAAVAPPADATPWWVWGDAGAAAPAPAAPAPTSVPAPAPAPAVAPRPVAEAKLVAEASARLKLEGLKQDMISRCWPESGLGGGRERAQLTFSLAFDASGKEIARGISEDRAAPAGAFARCLRALPIGSLSIPAPGARIGVKVAMAFP